MIKYRIFSLISIIVILVTFCSEDSSPVTTSEPKIPGIVQLSVPNNNANTQPINLTFQWRSESNAQSYELQVSTNQDITTPVINENNLTTITYQSSTNLNYQTTYYWRVRGINSSGTGPWSQIFSFTTTEQLTPPTLKLVSLLAPSNNIIDLPLTPSFQWKKNNDASHYHIQISTNNDLSNPITNTDTITDTTYQQQTPLIPATTYFWRVRAQNISIFGPWSQSFSFTTEQPTLKLVSLLAPSNNIVDLPLTPSFQWKKNNDASHYHIQISTNNDLSNPITNTDTITDTTYQQQTPLIPATTYFWRVRAQNTSIFGPWSQSFSFTTEQPTPPTLKLVSLLAPSNNIIDLPLTPSFQWKKNNDASHYHIQISTNNDLSNPITNTDTITDTTYQQQTPLISATTYFWRVRAQNTSIFGPWSQSFSFTTKQPTPPTLKLVSLLAPSNNIIDLPLTPSFQWKKNNDASHYHIQISTNNDLSNPIADTDIITSTIYQHRDALMPATTYFWRVRAQNTSIFGPWSQSFTLTTHDPLPFQLPDDPTFPTIDKVILLNPADITSNIPLTLVFTWTASMGGDHYSFQLSESNNFSSFIVNTDTITSTIYYHNSDLQPRTAYFWRVKPEGSHLIEEWSNIFIFTTGDL